MSVDVPDYSAPFPSVSPAFVLSVKVVVGVTCVLSILGAALIIFTYVAFRDLRTTARQILVNVSAADLLVAVSHLVGLYTNYERFLPSANNRSTDALCASQAAVLMTGTLASFFWTVALAVHLLLLVAFAGKRWPRMMLVVYYPLCWCVPVTLTAVLGGLGYLGFEKSADVGYCYARLIPNDSVSASSTNYTYTKSVVAQVMAYDLWLYMAFLAVPALFISTHCYLKAKLRSNFQTDDSYSSTPSSYGILRPTTDLKLLFIPAVFLLLRVWSLILDIPVFYVTDQERYDFRSHWINAVLVMLADIGDSAQGLANAILYCILTKQVRQRLLQAVSSCSCHCSCQCNWQRPNSSRQESTTQLIDSVTTNDTDSLGDAGGGAHGGRRWWLGAGTLQNNPFYGSLSLSKENFASNSSRSRATQ